MGRGAFFTLKTNFTLKKGRARGYCPEDPEVPLALPKINLLNMLPKVHPRRVPRHIVAFYVASALLLFSLAGCRTGTSEETATDRDTPPPVSSRFGDAYAIVLGETPSAPDAPPALLGGDSLVAQVRYAGGCEDHGFSLRHEAVRGDTARLWLHHDAHGDDCEALVYDEIRLPVPPEARDATTVLLLNPQSGPPHVVRWDGER